MNKIVMKDRYTNCSVCDITKDVGRKVLWTKCRKTVWSAGILVAILQVLKKKDLAAPKLWTGFCPNCIQLCGRWPEFTSRIRTLCIRYVLSVVKGLCASYWRGPMNGSQSRLPKVTVPDLTRKQWFYPNIDVTLWKCCSVITLYDPAYACVPRQLWCECCRHLKRFMSV